MRNISNYLNNSYLKELEDVKTRLMKNKTLQKLCENINLDNHISLILKYEKEILKCKDCQSLVDCTQSTKGYFPYLEKHENHLENNYSMCKFKKMEIQRKNQNLKSMHIPEKLLKITSKDLYKDESRTEILNYIKGFLNEYSEENYKKGFYISGKFGTGKSYILLALANKLSNLGYEVLIAYYPDLVRELKNSIKDNSIESKIEKLKNANVLMLDDIGGEVVTQYIRDEVLGPILTYRLGAELPTFFTSNFNLKELLIHLSEDRAGVSKVKASRVVERVKGLTKEFKLESKSYR